MSFGRWAMKGLVLVAALALLVALLAACGSDSGGGKTPKAGETASSGKTPASGQTPAAGDGGLQDLADLASQAAEGMTANVTYAYTTESNGQKTEQEWVMIQRPPDSRFEIHTTVSGQETRTIVIVTADKSYVCISASGAESCVESTSDQTQLQTASFAPLFDIPKSIAGGIGDLSGVDESEREIGGLHATCFKTDTAVLGGVASELCFSDGGIPLLLKGDAGGYSFGFEAKSASTDVTDADFEPPYEVTKIPTG